MCRSVAVCRVAPCVHTISRHAESIRPGARRGCSCWTCQYVPQDAAFWVWAGERWRVVEQDLLARLLAVCCWVLCGSGMCTCAYVALLHTHLDWGGGSLLPEGLRSYLLLSQLYAFQAGIARGECVAVPAFTLRAAESTNWCSLPRRFIPLHSVLQAGSMCAVHAAFFMVSAWPVLHASEPLLVQCSACVFARPMSLPFFHQLSYCRVRHYAGCARMCECRSWHLSAPLARCCTSCPLLESERSGRRGGTQFCNAQPVLKLLAEVADHQRVGPQSAGARGTLPCCRCARLHARVLCCC